MRTRRNHAERGAAVLEFALSWSLLLAVLTGTYQFGYSFYVYNQMMTNVAAAAELGSKIDYDTANPATYTTALKNMAVYGNTSAGTNPLVPGLTTSNVNVNVTMIGGVPEDLTVTITGYQIDALFTKFTFNGKPRVTAIYMGHVVCSTC